MGILGIVMTLAPGHLVTMMLLYGFFSELFSIELSDSVLSLIAYGVSGAVIGLAIRLYIGTSLKLQEKEFFKIDQAIRYEDVQIINLKKMSSLSPYSGIQIALAQDRISLRVPNLDEPEPKSFLSIFRKTSDVRDQRGIGTCFIIAN